MMPVVKGGMGVVHLNAEAAQNNESARLRKACHPACIVCGERSRGGLGLHFEREPDGSVVGHFACNSNYQGYPDRLHGGVVSMLLDAAMMNCLFAHRIQGVTARLNIRFRHPVKLGVDAIVRARLTDQIPPLYVLKAELLQNDRACALADAKFYGDEPADQDGEVP